MRSMLLKDAVSYYTNNDSSVDCVLLGETKGCHKVQFCKLFQSLLNRNMPTSVNRLLFNMFLEQKTEVNWNGVFTKSFAV